jgi:hypothetical protein
VNRIRILQERHLSRHKRSASGAGKLPNQLIVQNLTFYELDLGLNHVVRKWSEPTDRRANLLVQGMLSLHLHCGRR